MDQVPGLQPRPSLWFFAQPKRIGSPWSFTLWNALIKSIHWVDFKNEDGGGKFGRRGAHKSLLGIGVRSLLCFLYLHPAPKVTILLEISCSLPKSKRLWFFISFWNVLWLEFPTCMIRLPLECSGVAHLPSSGHAPHVSVRVSCCLGSTLRAPNPSSVSWAQAGHWSLQNLPRGFSHASRLGTIHCRKKWDWVFVLFFYRVTWFFTSNITQFITQAVFYWVHSYGLQMGKL